MRRIEKNAFLGCALIACLVFGTPAVAKPPSSPTRIVLDKLTKKGEGPTLRGKFTGHLESRNDECERGRTVKLYLRNGGTGESKLADTDVTGVVGNWQLEGSLYKIDRARIKLRSKVVGSKGHRHLCTADTLTRHFV